MSSRVSSLVRGLFITSLVVAFAPGVVDAQELDPFDDAFAAPRGLQGTNVSLVINDTACSALTATGSGRNRRVEHVLACVRSPDAFTVSKRGGVGSHTIRIVTPPTCAFAENAQYAYFVPAAEGGSWTVGPNVPPAEATRILMRLGGGATCATLLPAAPAPAQQRVQAQPPPPVVETQPASLAAWCMSSDDFCIDTSRGDIRILRTIDSPVIGANRSVRVRTLEPMDAEQHTVVTLSGARGLSRPSVEDLTGGVRAPNAAQQASTERPWSATPHVFAPRQPGDADLVVRVLNEAGNVVAERKVELIVEQSYLGAVRIGIATVFGGGVDRTYGARLAPGSMQYEVARTGGGELDVEVVLGTSVFMWDMIFDDSGGRRYVEGERGVRFVPVPYVAIGLVSKSASGVIALPSFHAGIEIEFARGFAVSGTFVARRVDRLLDGFAIGQAVDSDTTVSGSRYDLGLALVFSVSPEFLQIATGGGG